MRTFGSRLCCPHLRRIPQCDGRWASGRGDTEFRSVSTLRTPPRRGCFHMVTPSTVFSDSKLFLDAAGSKGRPYKHLLSRRRDATRIPTGIWVRVFRQYTRNQSPPLDATTRASTAESLKRCASQAYNSAQAVGTIPRTISK
jgi:hypothetical protein